jgi:multidrug efflux pump
VRLQDIATVTNGVENLRNLGLADGTPAVLLVLHRQPGANVIEVVNRIRALIPELQASIPASIRILPTVDRTETIRASLRDVERTLVISIVLVVLVVFLMLRNVRAALVPSVAVPLSLVGTFGAMYLLGFSLDNLSLMALTVATGFVVDDAIVVLENTSRHVEAGMPRMQAALLGAREVGFTVLAMSLSLISVFLPILLMGGIVGRTFREFAITLGVAILISLVISQTTTPMMCSRVLRTPGESKPQGRLLTAVEHGFDRLRAFYGRTLYNALEHPGTVMLVLAATVGLNIYLFTIIPKGFFPQQDTGSLQGQLIADQSTSFQSMQLKLRSVMGIVQADPAVRDVVGFVGGGGGGIGGGGGSTNSASIFVGLKPLSVRKMSADRVVAQLRTELRGISGARLYLQAVQDIRAGGRQSNSQYQYTMLSDNLADLKTWTPRITEALQSVPEVADVSSDQQDKGLDISLNIDRSTASRLGINLSEVDNTLYDAFGQRQVSTIYNDMNQYHVVMEVDPSFWQSPETLREVWVSTSGGALTGTQSTAGAVSDFLIGTSTTSAAGSTAATTGSTSSATPTTALNTVVASTSSPVVPASSTTSTPSAASIADAPATTSATNTTSTATAAAGGGSASTSSTASSTSAASTASSNAAQNAQLNALANSGRGGASTGSSVSTSVETVVPLAAFATYGPSNTPLSISHQGPFVATTISFNLPEGVSLSTGVATIERTMRELHVPISIHGTFAGTARIYQQSLKDEPWLIAAAVLAVYIVLGVLYESYVHPITILSTLPSAGVGAVLALLISGTEFSLIALIGVILLIGIVKKNAIMMIDVALTTERTQRIGARQAIYEACLLRFRPIMMTTFAALLGALPLAVTTGNGAELRQPLGISIVGGLILSQLLTLYTTPVVYLYLDRFRAWSTRIVARRAERALGGGAQHQPI